MPVQTTMLHVRGVVDASTLARWQRVLESAIAITAIEGSRQVIVDMTKVELVSLGAIFALAELTGRASGSV
ncbi:STAS domain-containing protein [Nocardia sp. NPDC057272]|uniref:STAS domain-containing protein n=1 Tax=Nocardia sp. NPDC057272 TaxID=3346079 RepID=UPI003643E70E